MILPPRGTRTSLLLLRDEEIEQKPKEVHLVKGFKDRLVLEHLSPVYSQDLAALRRHIAQGTPLPARFYRKGKGKYDDDALQQYGVMHLHLGGQNSDVLVFLFQFPDDVVLLEINDHRPFGDVPPGRSVRNQWYYPALETIAEARVALEVAFEKAEEAAKAKNADIRARLRLPRKD